jgi:hypothetical protein
MVLSPAQKEHPSLIILDFGLPASAQNPVEQGPTVASALHVYEGKRGNRDVVLRDPFWTSGSAPHCRLQRTGALVLPVILAVIPAYGVGHVT